MIPNKQTKMDVKETIKNNNKDNDKYDNYDNNIQNRKLENLLKNKEYDIKNKDKSMNDYKLKIKN